MHDFMVFIIIISGFLFVLLLNLLFTHLIITKTVKRIIIPRLVEKGYEFIRIDKIGFLKTGDFKNSTFTIKPYNPNGSFKITLYRYVYFKKTKKEQKTTVKIEWNLFWKTKIEFKPIL